MIRVTVTVKAGKECKGFVFTRVRHEPARRFREEPHAADNDKRRNALEDEREPPGEVRMHLLGTKSNSGSWDGASEPTNRIE